MITIVSFPTFGLAEVCAKIVGSNVRKSQVGTYCVTMNYEQEKRWKNAKRKVGVR